MRKSIAGCSVLLLSSLLWQLAAQKPALNKPEGDRLINTIKGPALYQAYCASCHGADAKGAGPVSKSLVLPPSDLTRIATRNGGTFPLARVSRIISGEEQFLPTGHGSRDMPVWGPIFSQVDADEDLGKIRIDNLARYLREIQKP